MTPPHVAYRIDARALLALLPHVDQSDLRQIREEFARYLTSPRSRASRDGGEVASWQEAWNAWTGATTPQRPGRILYTRPRCGECRRGVSTRSPGRNIARTGHPNICGACGGTGRGRRIQQQARYAAPPQPETQAEPEAQPETVERPSTEHEN